MSRLNFIKANRKFLPASTYFDNLYSEYKSLKPPVPDGPDRDLLDAIYNRRHNPSLTREKKFSWDDIYTFELTLLNYLPIDELRNKVIVLRAMYLNIFGQEKNKTYLDSNPPDPTKADLNDLQRDARFLLHQIHLSLGALSSRDGLGRTLTLWAAYMLGGAALIIFIMYMFINVRGLPGTPVAVAFFAGAMGGLVSILNRLQSIPTEGDPIYGLAAFWHGSYALFVSPLTGAAFGILLYLAIAGGILQGRFFPNIATPAGKGVGGKCGPLITASEVSSTSPPSTSPAEGSPTPQQKPSPTATASPGTTASPAPITLPAATANPLPTASPSPSISQSPATSPLPTASTASSPGAVASPSPAVSPARTANSNTLTSATASTSFSPSPPPPPTGSVSLKQFMTCSSPKTGVDYALLIIWCFLAGFAERLVPDTLNRLIDENNKTQVRKQ